MAFHAQVDRANEAAQLLPETGMDTLPDEQLRVEENDSSVNNLSPETGQDTPAVDVPQHFEENDDMIVSVLQPDTQLPIPDFREHFEEDDSMSLTNVAIAVSYILFFIQHGSRRQAGRETPRQSPHTSF
jgi:hypothetical protein